MLKSREQVETYTSHEKYWISFQAIGVCLLKMKETPVSQCEKNFLLEVSRYRYPPRIQYLLTWFWFSKLVSICWVRRSLYTCIEKNTSVDAVYLHWKICFANQLFERAGLRCGSGYRCFHARHMKIEEPWMFKNETIGFNISLSGPESEVCF